MHFLDQAKRGVRFSSRLGHEPGGRKLSSEIATVDRSGKICIFSTKPGGESDAVQGTNQGGASSIGPGIYPLTIAIPWLA